jgi:hypothetical protein
LPVFLAGFVFRKDFFLADFTNAFENINREIISAVITEFHVSSKFKVQSLKFHAKNYSFFILHYSLIKVLRILFGR